MSKARKSRTAVRPEYEFDYRRARRNRFASGQKKKVVAVVLEPDVARVFNSSESVNRLLRSVISAVPKRRNGASSAKPRRKLG